MLGLRTTMLKLEREKVDDTDESRH
jgi:hypothetical protein